MALRIRNQRRNFWTDTQVQALIAIRARTNDDYWYNLYGN